MEKNMGLLERFRHYHELHERKLEVIFFAAGFIFDVIAVGEGADHLLMILQQFVYLSIIGFILYKDILREAHPKLPQFSPKVEKLWGYRSLLLHFCLGTLMNIYSIFFLMSASFFSSIFFVILLFGVMALNEIKAVRKRGVDVKIGMYVICFFCFASLMFPLVFGHVGLWPFLCSFLATLGLVALMFSQLRDRVEQGGLKKRLLFPGFGVTSVFLLFYLLGLIPPVPLSAKKMGVYHQIERPQAAEALFQVQPWWKFWEPEFTAFMGLSTATQAAESENLKRVDLSDKYILYHERVWWKFWQNGDQEFIARPGDKIFFLAAITSPGRIDDTVFVHWYFHDQRAGWQSSDRIPLKINGGRKDGFRGITAKQNYDYGDGSWRASVETSDGREIGRMYFTVVKAEADSARKFYAETY